MTASRESEEPAAGSLRPLWWVDWLKTLCVAAAIASIIGGAVIASSPSHSWPWLFAGCVTAAGWMVAAGVLSLLHSIAQK